MLYELGPLFPRLPTKQSSGLLIHTLAERVHKQSLTSKFDGTDMPSHQKSGQTARKDWLIGAKVVATLSGVGLTLGASIMIFSGAHLSAWSAGMLGAIVTGLAAASIRRGPTGDHLLGAATLVSMPAISALTGLASLGG
jgi:hypothetical protein